MSSPYDPPTEDTSERLEPYDDPECTLEEYRDVIRRQQALIADLRAELSAEKCWHCRKPLPIRAFCAADLTDGRAYCSARCWCLEARDRAKEVF